MTSTQLREPNGARRIRESLGLSIEDVAKAADIEPRTLEMIEAGLTHNPRRLTKKAIAKALKKNVQEVFPR